MSKFIKLFEKYYVIILCVIAVINLIIMVENIKLLLIEPTVADFDFEVWLNEYKIGIDEKQKEQAQIIGSEPGNDIINANIPLANIENTEESTEETTEITTENTMEAIIETTKENNNSKVLLEELVGNIPREMGIKLILKKEPVPIYDLTEEEKNMLCFVSELEDSFSVESRLAVMKTVINRVESKKFPNSIYEVLFAPKQFNTMKKYYKGYTPTEEAVSALNRLIYGEDIFDGENVLFFANKKVSPRKIARGLYLISSAYGNNYYGQN